MALGSPSDILQLFLALAVGGLILSIVVLVVAPARGEDTCTVDDLDALDDAGPARDFHSWRRCKYHCGARRRRHGRLLGRTRSRVRLGTSR